MGYLYETHMHTCQGSACADTPGRDYILRYMDAGFSGIIITDHFFRGNCRVPRNQPWRDRVHQFCSGYEDARNEGEKHGFTVLFGWEENYEGDEYLIYGLDKAWMLEHPEMEHWTRDEQFREVHRYGGCVIQAHPFRARDYIRQIHLAAGCVDGIEIVNTANAPTWNALAKRYSQLLGLPVTVGSDNHHVSTMDRSNLGGIVLDEPLTDICDLVSIILAGQQPGLHIPVPMPEWTPDIPIDRPAGLFGRRDQLLTTDVARFLKDEAFAKEMLAYL